MSLSRLSRGILLNYDVPAIGLEVENKENAILSGSLVGEERDVAPIGAVPFSFMPSPRLYTYSAPTEANSDTIPGPSPNRTQNSTRASPESPQLPHPG